MAERDKADHVTVTYGLAAESLGLRAGHLAFLLSLANWFSGVNRDRPRSYLGLGAFNVVRAAAYRQCGGYEALRLTVLDDVKLGLLPTGYTGDFLRSPTKRFVYAPGHIVPTWRNLRDVEVVGITRWLGNLSGRRRPHPSRRLIRPVRSSPAAWC